MYIIKNEKYGESKMLGAPLWLIFVSCNIDHSIQHGNLHVNPKGQLSSIFEAQT